MNANERRLVSCEALSFFYEHLTATPVMDEKIREKANNVAKTFAKTKKLLTKKNIKVPQKDLLVVTKKDWKKMCKGFEKDANEAEKEAEDSDEEEE